MTAAVSEPGEGAAGGLGPARRGLRETGLGLITLGVVVFLFVAYQLFGTGFAERHDQSRLRQSFERAVASASNPPVAHPPKSGGGAGGATGGGTGGGGDQPTLAGNGGALPGPPVGTAIDHLVIPKIGVDNFIVQGTGEADLSQGPGHYTSTVLPGQVGNAGIAGHRTTYGAPFFRLDELQPGDTIEITDTSDHRYRFAVTLSEVVAPSDVSVLDPTPTAQLTLTTCNPRFSATSRLVVRATLTASATAPPVSPVPTPTTGAPTTDAPASKTPGPVAGVTATATANLGAGSGSALPPAIAYGVAVIGCWTLTRLAINRTRRWSRAGAFVVGTGVCLVPLWFCFDNVVRLLPSSV